MSSAPNKVHARDADAARAAEDWRTESQRAVADRTESRTAETETEPRARPRHRTPRPLLWLCAAVVSGGAIGSAWSVPLDAWRGILALSLATWIALLWIRVERRWLTRLALLALCAATAGRRAGIDASLRDAVTIPRAEVTAPVGVIGICEETGGTTTVRGRVSPSKVVLAVPRGLVDDGDLVAVDPVHTAVRWPRGPVEGPRARAGTQPAIEVAPDEVTRLARAPASLASVLEERVRSLRAALMRNARTIAEPETRALVLALLFGDTSELPEGLPDLFVRTGTFHVLAVSGMQVVLVVLFLIGPASRMLALLASWIARRHIAATWIALPLIVLFVPIAGGGAPIVRSALGAAFAFVAPSVFARRAVVVECAGASTRVRLARRGDSLSFWALALILECALHPEAPTSLSVQLSYAATLGLMIGTGPCLRLLRAWIGTDEYVARVSRTGRERSPWIRVPLDRAIASVACAVAASIAAVLATLPFVWSRLSEWSPFGILATPALGPSTTALLVLGWLRVFFGNVVPDLLLDPCARAMTASMRAFDLLPCTPAPLADRPMWLVLAACVGTFVAIAPRGRAVVARCTALAWAVLIVPWSAVPARVEITALDVGAGTAIVIDGPGLGTWVFDAGSRDRPDVAREALGPLLRRIDPGEVSVVLSHADRDHDGALPWLVDRYPPRVFAGALPAQVAERLPHTTVRCDLTTGGLRLPLSTPAAPGIALELQRGLCKDDGDNEGSRALFLRAGGESVLLCGDAEGDGLGAWLSSFSPTEPLRLVLWPHHGSDCDRLDAFLRATRPAEVWISASGTPDVLAELERRAFVTQCTARDGVLSATIPSGTSAATISGPRVLEPEVPELRPRNP